MLQSAQLIGMNTDEESLYKYSTDLLVFYIKEKAHIPSQFHAQN